MKKIKNLVLDSSDLDRIELQNSIRSEKNKLLAKSQWTQLLDSGLSVESQRQWANWRDRVRSIEISEDALDRSRSQIEELKAHAPSTSASGGDILQSTIDSAFQFNLEYAIIPTIHRLINISNGRINHYSSIDDLRVAAKTAALRYHQAKLNVNIGKFGHPELFRERYEEALMCTELTATPLLDILVEDTGLEKSTIVDNTISERIEYFKILLEYEKQIKIAHQQIESLTESELLDKLIEYGYRYRPSSIGPGDAENISN